MSYKPEDYFGVVHKVVNSICTKNPEAYDIREDIVQEGMVALCEVCKSYKPGPVDFPMYATVHVHNRIVNYLRRNENKFKQLDYLEDLSTPESDDGESMSWEEVIGGSVIDTEQVLHGMPEHLREFFLLSQTHTVQEAYAILPIGWSKFYQWKQDLTDYLEEVATNQ